MTKMSEVLTYKTQNIELKKLRENTSQELADYLIENIQEDILYKSVDVLNDFNGLQNKKITKTKISKSIRYFALLKNFLVNLKKSAKQYHFL